MYIYIYAILDIMNMFRGKKWSLKKYHHDFILAIGGLWNTKKAREVFGDKMSHKPVRSSWKGICPPNWPSTSGHWRLKTYSINTWGGPRIYIFSCTYTYPISYVWAWVVAGNPFVFSSGPYDSSRKALVRKQTCERWKKAGCLGYIGYRGLYHPLI